MTRSSLRRTSSTRDYYCHPPSASSSYSSSLLWQEGSHLTRQQQHPQTPLIPAIQPSSSSLTSASSSSSSWSSSLRLIRSCTSGESIKQQVHTTTSSPPYSYHYHPDDKENQNDPSRHRNGASMLNHHQDKRENNKVKSFKQQPKKIKNRLSSGSGGSSTSRGRILQKMFEARKSSTNDRHSDDHPQGLVILSPDPRPSNQRLPRGNTVEQDDDTVVVQNLHHRQDDDHEQNPTTARRPSKESDVPIEPMNFASWPVLSSQQASTTAMESTTEFQQQQQEPAQPKPAKQPQQPLPRVNSSMTLAQLYQEAACRGVTVPQDYREPEPSDTQKQKQQQDFLLQLLIPGSIRISATQVGKEYQELLHQMQQETVLLQTTQQGQEKDHLAVPPVPIQPALDRKRKQESDGPLLDQNHHHQQQEGQEERQRQSISSYRWDPPSTFKKHIIFPADPNTHPDGSQGKGYTVWCSFAPGTSTAPLLEFDSTWSSPHDAATRARYLYHWKNCWGFPSQPPVERVFEKSQRYGVHRPSHSSSCWRVGVVTDAEFDKLPHATRKRHIFDLYSDSELEKQEQQQVDEHEETEKDHQTTREQEQQQGEQSVDSVSFETKQEQERQTKWDATKQFEPEIMFLSETNLRLDGNQGNGYTVWYTFGFADDDDWGLEEDDQNTAAIELKREFDSTWPTVEQANARARFLFYWKNCWGLEPHELEDISAKGDNMVLESSTRNGLLLYSIQFEGMDCWTVGVVEDQEYPKLEEDRKKKRNSSNNTVPACYTLSSI